MFGGLIDDWFIFEKSCVLIKIFGVSRCGFMNCFFWVLCISCLCEQFLCEYEFKLDLYST